MLNEEKALPYKEVCLETKGVYYILQFCDFCLELSHVPISLMKFSLCSPIILLSSVNIFMIFTLNCYQVNYLSLFHEVFS